MTDHLLHAFALSGPKSGQRLTEEADIIAMLKAPDLAWLHLQADHADTQVWLDTHLDYLDPHAVDALLAEETRPRATFIDDGVMVFLRGVNTNPKQDPDDMVSIRIWLDAARIVSLSVRPLASVRDIETMIKSGQGPTRAGEFLCVLVERLNTRIESFLRVLDDETDALEETVLEGPSADLRRNITDTRRKIVNFRRYVGPQRDALAHLATGSLAFMTRPDERRLSEAQDRLVRTIEELDAMRERLTVVKDELASILSERLNRNLYMLSLISAVFLPLGFLTGLFGINLAGMPGADSASAFWVFSGALVAIVLLQLLILRLLRWF